RGCASECPIAAVGDPQLPPQFLTLNGNEPYASRKHLVARKTGANDGDAKACRDEALDHAYARQFHANLQLGGIRTKELIHDAPAESSFGQEQRLFCDVADRDDFQFRQRILRAHHQHQLIAKNGVSADVGAFHWKGYDAYVEGTGLQLFDNLVAEVSINADLHPGIEAAVFG